MKPYAALLLDADDTLLDFKATEKQALQHMFETLHLPFSAGTAPLYSQINRDLWKKHEKELISREELLLTRFGLLFEQLGITADGQKAEQIYRQGLEQGTHLIEGALEACRLLAKKYPLYIVTNGVRQTQISRLKKSGLSPFFQDIFVSETAGAAKPSPLFFEYMLSHMPGYSPHDLLLTGDSLSSDIKGGNNSGIDTCWFNPGKLPNTSDAQPQYEIQTLHQLVTLVEADN